MKSVVRLMKYYEDLNMNQRKILVLKPRRLFARQIRHAAPGLLPAVLDYLIRKYGSVRSPAGGALYTS